MAAIRIVDPLPVQVARPMVLLRLGYRRPAQVPERTARLIDEVMEKGRGLLAPRAIGGTFDVATADADVTVIGGTLRAGRVYGTSTQPVQSADLNRDGRPDVVGLDIASGRVNVLLNQGDGTFAGPVAYDFLTADQRLQGFFPTVNELVIGDWNGDGVASSAAIALGLEVETIAAATLAEEGLAPTKRHAPGYADWPLSDQGPLCGLIDAPRIGITLTEDFLMLPAKSISGVIGGR